MKYVYKILIVVAIALAVGIVFFFYVITYKPLIAARLIVMADNNYTADNYDRAVSQLTIALWLVPKHALAYTYRAKTYSKMGIFSKAISDATRAINLLPAHGPVYCLRGSIYTQMGNYPSALRDYKKSVEVAHFNTKAEMLNSLAWFLATCPSEHFRDGIAAVSNAKQACQLTEWKNYEMLHTLGVAHAAAGNFNQAIHWSTKALALAKEERRYKIEFHLELFKQGMAYYQETMNIETIN